MEARPNVYDEVTYPAGSVDYTHPGRLAMMARLFGVAPAPVERCRYLEIGCGSGGNLLPLAELFPESTFVGVDLAQRPIAEGRAWAERIGARNLTLVQGDLSDFDPGAESFDYVVAHGVYSWVPEAVRERLFAVFRRALAPTGVAYVSYNALPGGHLRRAIRDMMLFHTRGIADQGRRISQARALTAFLADAAPAGATTYKALLAGQKDRIAKMEDGFLFHDDLADHCEPFYFHQVIEHAARHGLAYLSEVLFEEMSDQTFPPSVRQVLRGAGDVVAFEQYLDFVVGRSFRRTLLVREEVALERRLDGASVRPFYALSLSKPVSERPDLAGPSIERFENRRGVRMGLQSPLAKAAMTILAESTPRALSFDELLSAARERLGSARAAPADDEERELGEILLAALGGDMVQLFGHRPPIAAAPGERPRATRLAREQAVAGSPVTDLWHSNVRDLDPFSRRLLALLDGSRDRAALLEALAAGTGDDPATAEQPLDQRVEATLAALARHALLVA